MRSSLNVLWLYVLLFLALLPVLFFAFYSGIMPTGISGHGFGAIATIATIGLLALPALFVFLGIAVLAAAARMAKHKPARYPWEDVFPEAPDALDRRKAVHIVHKTVEHGFVPPAPPSPPKAFKAEKKFTGAETGREVWAIALVAAVILFILLVRVTPGVKDVIFGQGSNATIANVTKPNITAGIAVERQSKPLNAAGNASQVNVSAAFASVVGKAKRQSARLAGLAGSAGSAVGKVPERAWQGAAVAVLVIVLAASVFYSYKARSLGQAVLWGKGWLGWIASFLVRLFANRSEQKGFAAVFGAARKNKLKLLISAVAAAAVAAFVFRAWLGARLPQMQAKLPLLPKLSGIADTVTGFLSAASDFLSAYRLYIIIGIFALLVVIAFLFFLERRGKGGNA